MTIEQMAQLYQGALSACHRMGQDHEVRFSIESWFIRSLDSLLVINGATIS